MLQHWHIDSYHEWKRQLVIDALKEYKLDVAVSPLIGCSPYSRRRMTLTASMTPQGQRVGFNRHLSHEIVSLEECPVSCSQIISKLGDIRKLCAFLSNHAKRFHITVTCIANGLDVAVSGCIIHHELLRQKIIHTALACGITRLSVEGEVFVEREKPLIYFGDVCVEFPAGGFSPSDV